MFLARTSKLANLPVRFDVIAIDSDHQDGETIEWIRDAFRPGDSCL
jgi:Holliday junction resolvase-like predicted endonuclease